MCSVELKAIIFGFSMDTKDPLQVSEGVDANTINLMLYEG